VFCYYYFSFIFFFFFKLLLKTGQASSHSFTFLLFIATRRQITKCTVQSFSSPTMSTLAAKRKKLNQATDEIRSVDASTGAAILIVDASDSYETALHVADLHDAPKCLQHKLKETPIISDLALEDDEESISALFDEDDSNDEDETTAENVRETIVEEVRAWLQTQIEGESLTEVPIGIRYIITIVGV
jgi:hypothetical protein